MLLLAAKQMNIPVVKKINVGFSLMIVALVALGMYTIQNLKVYKKTNQLVVHTNQVLHQSKLVLAMTIDLESAQRGYIITGDTLFLKSYASTKHALAGHLENLIHLLKEDAPPDISDTLSRQIHEKIKLNDALIRYRNQSDWQLQNHLQYSYKGKVLMDKVKGSIDQMEKIEQDYLRVQIQKNQQKAKLFNITLFIVLLLMLALLVGLYLLVKHHLKVRTENEQRIRHNESLMQSILDQTDCGIFIKNLNGEYILGNKQFCQGAKLLGTESVVGKTDYDIFPPHVAKKLLENDGQVIVTEQLIRIEETIPLPKGERTFLTVLFPLRDTSNSISSICGISTDITERTQAEQIRLFHSHVLTNATDAIVATDNQFKVTIWNKGAEELFGFLASEVMGKISQEVLRTELSSETRAKLHESLRSGQTFRGEINYYHKDGRKIPCLVSSTHIKDKAGNGIGFLGVVKDVTDFKKQQDEIMLLNKELEAFSYSVSHDLRAPLRSIDGYTRILTEDYAQHMDEEGKRITGVILKNTHRMGALIDNLLAFAHLNRKGVKRSRINMHELVVSIWEDLQGDNKALSAQLTVDQLPVAYGDLDMIRQVWVNLLQNAIKYSSKKESPAITIGATNQQEEAVYFIRDNGVGFDMRYADKLFGVFQRLHGEEEFEGTGVGLALVHRILTKHGGKIWAEGVLGKGAQFNFSIPNVKQGES